MPYFRRYRWRFALGVVFVTLSNICSTRIPRVTGNAIDMLMRPSFASSDVLEAVVWLLLLTIGSGAFMMLTRQTIIVASRLIERDLRNDLLKAFTSLPLSYFRKTPTGEAMALATNDISAIREFIGPAVMYTANTVTTFFFALWMMFALDWQTTLISLIPLPLMSFSVYAIGKRVHHKFKDVQNHYSTLTSNVQESISGVRVVRAYGREENETNSFLALADSYRSKNLSLTQWQAGMMPANMVLVGLSQIGVLYWGGSRVMDGLMSYGDLAQFFMYLSQLIWPVVAVGWVTNLIQRASASSARLFSAMNAESDIVEAPTGTLPAPAGAVSMRDVWFRYAPGQPWILQGLSIDIPAGSTVGIVGPTGVGKTTFVNLLARLFDPTEGHIRLDEKDLKEYPLGEVRERVAVVPQEAFLFSLSLTDNVRFGKPSATDQEVREAGKTADIARDIEGFPEGWDTVVGERGVTLSGGQKQRMAIARSAVKNAPVIVFDDSLSAVDAETEQQILGGIRAMGGRRTVIIVANRMASVRHADKIILLDKGAIAASGTHEELLAQSPVYKAMVERQRLEEEIEEVE